MKWGMTSSMVSAEIISDMITGRKNKNAEVFSPQRYSVNDVKQTCVDEVKSIKCLIKEPLAPAPVTLSDLSPGHGKIVSDKDGKRGVYKDFDGTVYVVDIKCPHLGCQLEWNPDEKSWDCPCHGSRFDYRGKLIDNPAQKDLKGRTK
ncbi:MAG: Cytochrome b6-f complex iron-sulfur subunit 1 [Firmicutes bacterium ADurb.Bin300]|nr:MAG: Cytochrome b6-f complex iron-sulfur subunit 1 [Firmicutes bacterium ADurb.Bin300]